MDAQTKKRIEQAIAPYEARYRTRNNRANAAVRLSPEGPFRNYRLERDLGHPRWVPAGGAGSIWPWPSLCPLGHSTVFYKTLITHMLDHSPLGRFRKVLDIGQDRGESIMWISTIADTVLGLDIDSRMIDLSTANYRMSGRARPQDEIFVLPEKSLVDADDPRWSDIDLIKIDAGEKTLFVLEALEEVIARNKPLIFVIHSNLENREIWDYLIRRHDYWAEVQPDNQPRGVTVAYAHIPGEPQDV